MNIVITDKTLGVKEIEGLIISGENNANIIDIEFPKTYENVDLSDKTFVIKCINQSGIYFETILPKKIEAEKIILTWTVSKEFTSVAGTLKIAVFTEDSEDYILGTKTSKLMVESSPSITVPIDSYTVFEKYLKEMRVLTDVAIIASKDSQNILTEMNSKIVDNLTTDSVDKALAAKQGKILNERINNIVGQFGTDNTEIVDARYSNISGTTYPNLSARIADTEKEIEKGLFSDTQSATQPIISLPPTAIEGGLTGSLKGNTLYNAVVNGDFANGTTGWKGDNAIISTMNKVATMTANGLNETPGMIYGSVITMKPTKFFFKARVKATSSDCLRIKFRFFGGSKDINIESPIINQWYDVYDVGTSVAASTNLLTFYATYANLSVANGKSVEIDGNAGVFAIPISGTPYENWTADQMYNLISGYWEGLGCTKPSRVKSIGKNLLDGELEKGSLNRMNGLPMDTPLLNRTKNFTKVKPSTSYVFSELTIYANGALSVCFYDKNKIFISRNYAAFSTNTPSKCHYIKISYNNDQSSITDTPMMNEGTVALPYEPYTETSLYCPVELRNVPNGITDEFTFDGKLTQRTKEYILGSTDIAMLTTTRVNVDTISIPIINIKDCVKSIGGISQKTFVIQNFTPSTLDSILDDLQQAWKYIYTSTIVSNTIILVVPKGTYTTLAQAQTALAGTKIIYQLATPIETQYPVSALQCNPSGTIYVENVTKVNKIYGLGIAVTLPIKTIESVTLVDGVKRTPIDTSLVTVSGDKLSVTILNAKPTEFYEIVYEYDGAVLPTIDYKYPMNFMAQLRSISDTLFQVSKEMVDFRSYQNAVNVQFDLRLITGGH